MASALLPGSILSLPAQAARRLLELDNGDAALLYLYLLGHESAAGLPWPRHRVQAALEVLARAGLASLSAAPPEPPAPPEQPPEYALEDISAALEEEHSPFAALCDEVERRLGKRLSGADLKSLYTLYDHLALPPEVILLLVTWCVEEQQRKYGPGRRPFLSQIRRQGFVWARRGIDTLERAEEYLHKLSRLQSREGELLRLLDIPPRPLVERERSYLEAWDQMGFSDDALRLAYEKTVLKKQGMDWGYMNGILRRWHEKGLHTLAAIQTGDGRRSAAGTAGTAPAAGADSARADMARMRRILDQMKEGE